MLKKFAVAALMALSASAAPAAVIQATYTGTITRGTNKYGMFGPNEITGESAVIRYIVDVGFLERIVTPEGRKVWRGTNGDTPIKSASITINGVTLDVPVFGDLPEGNGYAEHTGTGAALDAVNHQTLAFRENFNNTTVVSYVSTFVGSYSSNFVPSDDMSVPVDYQVKSDDVVYGTFYIHSRDLLGDKWNYIAEADFRTERVQIGLLSAVPEPTTWAMMIAGFALTGARARRAREWKTA